MDEKVTNNRIAFPDENVSAERKASDSYGLKVAKAIYEHGIAYGANLFYGNKDLHEAYRKYALGEQSVDKYKPMLGINPKSSKKSLLKAIRWDIKNYATKRVNIVTEKIASQRFDVSVDPIDPLSVDAKEDYKARLKVFIKNKEWLTQLGNAIGQDLTPAGLSPDEVPLNDEEIEIHAQMNQKTRASVEIEMGIERNLERTRYYDKKRVGAFHSFVVGSTCFYVGLDKNFVPVLEVIDPSTLIVPWTDDPLHKDRKFTGCVKETLISDLMKIGSGELTHQDLEIIRENQAKHIRDAESQKPQREVLADVEKVEVMHFEYKTVNDIVGVEKTDEGGNKRFHTKPYDYYATAEEQKKFRKKYKGSRKLIRKQYNCIYEGYWVVGTDYILGWKKKQNQEREYGNYGDSLFGYKIMSPNLYSGRVVSTVKQMIPVLDNLQMYALKLRQFVVNAIPKGVQVDLNAVRATNLDFGDGEMSDKELMDMIISTGMVLFDGSDNYHIGSANKVASDIEFGMSKDLPNILSLIQQELFELDEIIGMNAITAGSTVGERTGKRVAEIQQNSSEVALGYLYDADRIMFEEIIKSMARLHVLSMKYGDQKHFSEIFGKNSVDFTKGIIGKDLGLVVRPSATKEEWEEFYATVREAISAGLIPLSAETAIREIPNMKMARRYLTVIERRTQRERAEQAQADARLNAEAQQQSAEVAHGFTMQQKEADAVLSQQEKQADAVENEKQRQHEMALKQMEISQGAEAQKDVDDNKAENEMGKIMLDKATDPETEVG